MTSAPQLIEIIRHFMDIAMHHSFHERAHLAKFVGLSMPQLGILFQLHYRGTCGISELSEKFDITNAATSQLVDKLVQSGFVQRAEDPQDRRAKLLNLSEKGKELLQQSAERRYRWVEEIAKNLSSEEREQVSEALEILTRAAQDLEVESLHHSG
jgi:DNA-binding MarR family transcriptional regulator